MRTYNLYFKQAKVNKKPLTKEELEYIKQYEVIKKVQPDNTTIEIPIKSLRIVEQITF